MSQSPPLHETSPVLTKVVKSFSVYGYDEYHRFTVFPVDTQSDVNSNNITSTKIHTHFVD